MEVRKKRNLNGERQTEKLLMLSDLTLSIDEKEWRNHKQEEGKCMARGNRLEKEAEEEIEVGAYVSQT